MSNQKVPEKRQTMRVSEADLILLNGTFAGNETLLEVMRKAMFFMELSKSELGMLEVFKDSNLMRLMHTSFLPTISTEIPIGQNIDLWMTVEITNKEPWHVAMQLIGRGQFVTMLEEALARIESPKATIKPTYEIIKSPVGKISAKKEDLDQLTEVTALLIARNTYIAHVEQHLSSVRVLSGSKKETKEEIRKRMGMDSSK